MGIEEDQSKTLWVATQGSGLFKITPIKGDSKKSSFTFKNVEIESTDSMGTSRNIMTGLHLDTIHSNRLWIHLSKGLHYLDIDTEQFGQFIDPSLDFLSKHSINSLTYTSDSTIVVLVNGYGIQQINLNTKKIQKLNINDETLKLNRMSNVLMDKEGKIWVSIFGGGVGILSDVENEKMEFIRHDIGEKHSLSNNNTNPILEDMDGNIWIGTSGGGINFYNPSQFRFPLFRNIPTDQKSISSNHIRAIFSDSEGNAWIGSNSNGINIAQFDEDKRRIDSLVTFKSFNDGSEIDLSSHAIFEDSQKRIYISSRSKGVSIFDLEKKKFRSYINRPNDIEELSNFPVYSYYEFSGQYLLFGTMFGVYKYDFSSSDCSLFFPTKRHDINAERIVTNTLHVNEQGKVLIGTANYGVYSFDPDSNQYKHFGPDAGNEYSISTNRIICSHSDKNGNQWFGTWEGGLNLFDASTENFKSYNEADGLVNNTIYSIQEDEKGDFWLSTNKGLSRFDPLTETFKNFDLKYNLQGDEYNSRVGFTSDDGTIYFGGMTGLNIFNPDEVERDTSPPELYFTKLTRYRLENGEDIVLEDSGVRQRQKIELDHNDKTVEFQFSTLKLPQVNNISFSYQLAGFSNNWIQLDDRTNFNLTNLDQGNFKLIIKAVSINEDWLDQKLVLDILVQPPWWETWWAYLIYVFLIGSILYGIYRYRLSQLIKYQNLRSKISSDLHDDVGTILTAAAMQTEILSWSLPEEEAKKVTHIASLNRTAIERMRDTV